ncbi:MAG: putative metal-binding motif-containing protein [Myxococcales bacterium]|nr:putative metal-binding motif-containing protein [Myxococcales bacterium]
MWFTALWALSPSAYANDVLLLWDTQQQDTPTLVKALEAAGLDVTWADVPEWEWDGTNPSPDGFGTVLHLDGAEPDAKKGQKKYYYNYKGAAWDQPMPIEGQQALVDFVAAGGGYIHEEWMAYEFGDHGLMADLILLRRTSGDEGKATVTVAKEQAKHPLWDELPPSFAMQSGFNIGSAAVFAKDPVTVVATSDRGDAVVVRELGDARIVGFHHTGNYLYYDTFTDPNVQQLIVNAVLWTTQCDVDGDGDDRTGVCGGDDCADDDAGISSFEDEQCDGFDTDCDGTVDGPDPVDGTTSYADTDGDGYGDAAAAVVMCAAADGYVADASDCDDTNGDVHPDGVEVAYDGLDNDCDGGDLTDVDGDGYGIDEDCDDDDAAVNPGATELAGDGIDNDCDDGDAEPSMDDDDGDGDCGCQSPGSAPAWLLIAALGLVRRRA